MTTENNLTCEQMRKTKEYVAHLAFCSDCQRYEDGCKCPQCGNKMEWIEGNTKDYPSPISAWRCDGCPLIIRDKDYFKPGRYKTTVEGEDKPYDSITESA